MAFTSLPYAVFLAAAVAVYYQLPARWRWAGLACGQLRLLLQLGHGLGALCGDRRLLPGRAGAWPGRGGAARKPLLAAGVLGCLAPLLFYKYWNFAAENIAALLRLGGWAGEAPAFSLALPVGISFFTFQAVGYLVDVYRGRLAAGCGIRGILRSSWAFSRRSSRGRSSAPTRCCPSLPRRIRSGWENWTAGLQRICIGAVPKACRGRYPRRLG